MKTLAELKRNIADYELSLKENSWFKQVPAFQKAWRPVATVQSNSFSLLTDKGDSQPSESWCDFPKASELQLIPLSNEQDLHCMIIKRDCGDKLPHIMIYELRKKSA